MVLLYLTFNPTHLEPVVGPGPHLEVADLVVEREEGDVDLARGAEANDGRPEDVSVRADHRQALHVAGRVVIHAARDTGSSKATPVNLENLGTKPAAHPSPTHGAPTSISEVPE